MIPWKKPMRGGNVKLSLPGQPIRSGQGERTDDRSECAEFGEKFCVLWSTAGYLAQSCLVPCLAALFSLLFIFLHRGRSLFPAVLNSKRTMTDKQVSEQREQELGEVNGN